MYSCGDWQNISKPEIHGIPRSSHITKSSFRLTYWSVQRLDKQPLLKETQHKAELFIGKFVKGSEDPQRTLCYLFLIGRFPKLTPCY